MSDLINRQAAIDAIDSLCKGESVEEFAMYRMAVNDAEWAVDALPSAQPERKKGKWQNAGMNTYELSYGTTAYEPVYRCSVCRSVTESYLRLDEPIMPEDADFPDFCPNCGADMRNN